MASTKRPSRRSTVKAKPRRSTSPRSRFYARVAAVGGELVPTEVYGSAVKAKGKTGNPPVRCLRFVPLDTPKRFCMVELTYFRGDRYPNHPLAIPREAQTDFDCSEPLDGLKDRATAMGEVAEFNRYLAPNTGRPTWAVLCEVGEPVPVALMGFELEPNGMGCRTTFLSQPIRIVEPTAAERARFAKGGQS